MKLRLFEVEAMEVDRPFTHTFPVWARDFDDAWQLAENHVRAHLPTAEVVVINDKGVTSDGHSEYPDA